MQRSAVITAVFVSALVILALMNYGFLGRAPALGLDNRGDQAHDSISADSGSVGVAHPMHGTSSAVSVPPLMHQQQPPHLLAASSSDQDARESPAADSSIAVHVNETRLDKLHRIKSIIVATGASTGHEGIRVAPVLGFMPHPAR